MAAANQKNVDRLPLRLMFEDEARFGRMSDPRACWAPAPHRPVVNLALVREFRYEYAAVSPWVGSLDYMTAEKMNTDSMSRFLAQISQTYTDEFIVMVRGWSLIPQKHRPHGAKQRIAGTAATLFA